MYKNIDEFLAEKRKFAEEGKNFHGFQAADWIFITSIMAALLLLL